MADVDHMQDWTERQCEAYAMQKVTIQLADLDQLRTALLLLLDGSRLSAAQRQAWKPLAAVITAAISVELENSTAGGETWHGMGGTARNGSR